MRNSKDVTINNIKFNAFPRLITNFQKIEIPTEKFDYEIDCSG